MYMFESMLKRVPKNRSEMVNDLEIPDLTLTPSRDEDLSPVSSVKSVSSDSLVTTLSDKSRFVRGSASTDSSMPMSRAMTDSEMSYGRYKRYMSRRGSEPFDLMKDALDLFPSEYITSLHKYRSRPYTPPLHSSEELTTMLSDERRRYWRDVRARVQKLLDNDYLYDNCHLLELEDALNKLDAKVKDTLAYRRYDYLNLDWPYYKYSDYCDYDYPYYGSYWRWKRRYWPYYGYSYTI